MHVFMNLLVNSAHAIKAAGRDSEAQIKISCTDISVGGCGSRVRDNGCGVSAANLPKLARSILHDQRPGEGMGLGLSICHTIVKNHGGTMSDQERTGAMDGSQLRSAARRQLRCGVRHEHRKQPELEQTRRALRR